MIVPLFLLLLAQAAPADEASIAERYHEVDQQRQACWSTKDWACVENVLEGMLVDPDFRQIPALYRNTLYNLACAHALQGERAEALRRLAESVDAGYDNYIGTRFDSDFTDLRGDSTFVWILDGMRRSLGVTWDPARSTNPPTIRTDRMTVPELVQLRSQYELDQVVAGAADDYERVRRITSWTHGRWSHNGNNEPSQPDPLTILREAGEGKMFRCVEYGTVVAGAARALGMPARVLALKTHDVETRPSGAGHVVAEVWLRDQKKWIFADGQFDVIPERDGRPLSGSEFAEAMWDGGDLPECRSTSQASCSDYLRWVTPYLYYLDYSLDQRMFVSKQEGSLMMVPKGAPDPKVFQQRWPIGPCTYISDPLVFNRPPEGE